MSVAKGSRITRQMAEASDGAAYCISIYNTNDTGGGAKSGSSNRESSKVYGQLIRSDYTASR
jgi:hypothetical protein